MNKQNPRDTAKVHKSLLRSRHDRAEARADLRWNGASKMLALLARGTPVVTGAYAVERFTSLNSL